MTHRIEIKTNDTFSLGQKVTQANNALAARVRRIRKRGNPWPRVKLLDVAGGVLVYEVTE